MSEKKDMKASAASEYGTVVENFRKNRESFLFEAPSGFVFELAKLLPAEALHLLSLYGLTAEDLENLDGETEAKASVGWKMSEKFDEVANEMLPEFVKSPKIVTKEEDKDKNSLLLNDLTRSDRWALVNALSRGSTGAGGAQLAETFQE